LNFGFWLRKIEMSEHENDWIVEGQSYIFGVGDEVIEFCYGMEFLGKELG
jgi:GMP synthase-like glutamine amidotransferase